MPAVQYFVAVPQPIWPLLGFLSGYGNSPEVIKFHLVSLVPI